MQCILGNKVLCIYSRVGKKLVHMQCILGNKVFYIYLQGW